MKKVKFKVGDMVTPIPACLRRFPEARAGTVTKVETNPFSSGWQGIFVSGDKCVWDAAWWKHSLPKRKG